MYDYIYFGQQYSVMVLGIERPQLITPERLILTPDGIPLALVDNKQRIWNWSTILWMLPQFKTA